MCLSVHQHSGLRSCGKETSFFSKKGFCSSRNRCGLSLFFFFYSIFRFTPTAAPPPSTTRTVWSDLPQGHHDDHSQHLQRGLTRGGLAFYGGVFDGNTMTLYNGWPAGVNRGSAAFVGGAFDGSNLSMVPHTADAVVKVSTSTGSMTK